MGPHSNPSRYASMAPLATTFVARRLYRHRRRRNTSVSSVSSTAHPRLQVALFGSVRTSSTKLPRGTSLNNRPIIDLQPPTCILQVQYSSQRASPLVLSQQLGPAKAPTFQILRRAHIHTSRLTAKSEGVVDQRRRRLKRWKPKGKLH